MYEYFSELHKFCEQNNQCLIITDQKVHMDQYGPSYNNTYTLEDFGILYGSEREFLVVRFVAGTMLMTYGQALENEQTYLVTYRSYSYVGTPNSPKRLHISGQEIPILETVEGNLELILRFKNEIRASVEKLNQWRLDRRFLFQLGNKIFDNMLSVRKDNVNEDFILKIFGIDNIQKISSPNLNKKIKSIPTSIVREELLGIIDECLNFEISNNFSTRKELPSFFQAIFAAYTIARENRLRRKK